MSRPIAKGLCESCGIDFIIWKPTSLLVTMHPAPKIPTITCQCPMCGEDIVHSISYKDATTFNKKGVAVTHSYDEGTDLQPISELEIQGFLNDPDELLKKLVND